jgi:hypothetical protein
MDVGALELISNSASRVTNFGGDLRDIDFGSMSELFLFH